MQLAVFSSSNESGFARGWVEESAVAVFGSIELDLTKRPPAPDATLAATAVFGSVKVIVPAGTHVRTSGMALFGSAQSKVGPGAGPELHIRAFTLFGGITVAEGAAVAPEASAPAGNERTFPF